jgi:5'-nucleotidase
MFIVLMTVFAMVTATLATTASAAPDKPHFTLTILHNNDGESELLPDGDEGGVARFKTVVDREKSAAIQGGKGKKSKRGVIMVSSGDNFLASPAFTASLNDGVFYDALALDMIGYDAIDLGNHDFDFGPDLLAEFITTGFANPGTPPYLSANLDFSGEVALQALVDSDVVAASTIVKERGEEIAIIGATTENLPFISSPRNVVVNLVLPAVLAEIAEVEAMGIDKIIFISHLQDIDGDILLAADLSGVDVMIAGGGDELLANDGDLLLPSDVPELPLLPDIFGPYPMIAVDADGRDVPVVTTSGQYGYLGRLVVDFDKDGNVIAWSGGPIRIVGEGFPDGAAADPVMQTQVVDPVAEFVEALATNVIATSQVDLDGLRTSVRSMESNEGNLIADSQLWQAQQLAASFSLNSPQVALQNGGGIRNDSIIPAGDITELNTFEMVPFPNFLAIVEDIQRSQFKEILENAVSRTQPGDTPGGTGRFAQIAGFTFVYDTSGIAQVLNSDGTVATAGTRITEVALGDGTVIVTGGAVVAGDPIDIAIIDFLARGGDQYPFRGAPFSVVGVSYQQALSNYIQALTGDGGLGGLITSADYPFGGEGRITAIP